MCVLGKEVHRPGRRQEGAWAGTGARQEKDENSVVWVGNFLPCKTWHILKSWSRLASERCCFYYDPFVPFVRRANLLTTRTFQSRVRVRVEVRIVRLKFRVSVRWRSHKTTHEESHTRLDYTHVKAREREREREKNPISYLVWSS